MQVACKQCGAQYHFDAAAIPPGGYEASCTTCGSQFFVAPEQPVEVEVSVACSSCGVVYRFPRSAVPEAGYDAECTQCHQTFFVSPNAATQAAPAQPPAASPEYQPAPQPPMPEAAPVTLSRPVAAARPSPEPPPPPPADFPPAPLPPVAPDEPVLLKRPAPQPAADAGVAAAAQQGSGFSDVLELSAELGDPLSTADGSTPEEDFELIMQRRRRRRRFLVTVLVLVGGYATVTYFAVPRLFDLSIGRFVGIKRAVDPQALPLVDKGRGRMLDDTDAAYAQALDSFKAALAIDPTYGEALVLSGLSHVFRGVDLQARGRAIYDIGAQALAQLSSMEASGKRDATRMQVLRAQATRSRDESSKLFEAGGKEVAAGAEQLAAALKASPGDGLALEASGIYLAADLDTVGRAQDMLQQAVQAFGQSQLDPQNPPDAWGPLLRAMILNASPESLEKARPAYEAALKKEPRLQRARFLLMSLLDSMGLREEARRQAELIVSGVPDHEKAKQYLAGAAARDAADPRPPPPGKGKRKGKRR